MSEALTDDELDVLLWRFDRTEPALQRRIVAKLTADRLRLLTACKAYLSVKHDPDYPGIGARDRVRAKAMIADAVAQAEAPIGG